jgi:hypothetical protein
MSFTVDLRRELDSATKQLRRALEPINSSVSYSLYRGTSIHDAIQDFGGTPNNLRMIGGLYDPVGCRFLQALPVAPSVRVKLTPQQIPPLLSESQLITVVGAERSGKSRVGFFLNVKVLINNPGSGCLYLVPSYQKQQIIVELIDEYLAHLVISRNENKHEYRLANGSAIRIFTIAGGQAGVPNEAFLGFSASAITLEEFRQFPHAKAIFDMAFSRTINTCGKLIIVSSPESGHYLEDIVVNKVLDQDMDVHYLSALDNFLGKSDRDNPDAIFDKARRIYPRNKYLRDVLGQFVPADDNDYCEFDKDIHVIGRVPGTPVTHLLWQSDLFLRHRPGRMDDPVIVPNPSHRMRFILGLDLGKIISGVVIQASIEKNTVPFPHDIDHSSLHLTVIHELVKLKTNLVDYINTVLLRFFRQPNEVAIICDPAGVKESELDGKSAIILLRKAGFKVFAPKSYPPRQEAVDVVNLRFKLNLLHILAGCTRTIESIQKFKSDGRSQKDLSRDPFGHLCDALKYVVTMLFPWIDMLRPENEQYLNELSKSYGEGILK